MPDNKDQKKLQRLEKKLEKRVSKAKLADLGEAISEDLLQTIAKFSHREDNARQRAFDAYLEIPDGKNDRTLSVAEKAAVEKFHGASEEWKIASLYRQASEIHREVYHTALGVLEVRGRISEETHNDATKVDISKDSRAVKRLKQLIDKIEDIKDEPLEGMQALKLLGKNPNFKLEEKPQKKRPTWQI
jgi:hypothetical protein